jgi:hypothetical protein
MKQIRSSAKLTPMFGINLTGLLNSREINVIRCSSRCLLFASLVALAACRLEAADLNLFGTNMPPLDFHGFVSQGFLATTKYNYLGDNTKDGSFKFTEAGLNVSMNPFPRTHITVQGFLYGVGDYGKYQPFLDYASIDYTFNDYIGVRGGRIRRPAGIYNDIQDVDLARTFVLLPQGVYNATFRDLTCSLDGGELFGNVPLSKAGALSYEAYAGYVTITTDDGVANLINNSLNGGKTTSFEPLLVTGYQFWWSTPVEGLRFGAAFDYGFNLDYGFQVPTGAPPPFPAMISLSAKGATIVQQYSAEYLWKNWTFQAEYCNSQDSQDTTSPAGTTHSFGSNYSWYGSTAYRFNKWLEVGGYYGEYYASGAHAVAADGYQKDLALSFRFDPKPWWVLKVEGHYIRGTALLDDNANNPVRNDDDWFMLMVKTTFSF